MSSTPYFDAYERTRASRPRIDFRTTSDYVVPISVDSGLQADWSYSNIIPTSSPHQREYRLNKCYTEVWGTGGSIRVLADATLEFRDTAYGPWMSVNS